LTQWLGNPTDFNPGDVYSINSGMNDLLPGFLIGTSPIVLGSDGFTTDHPFTGNVFVAATIDGETVPEPGTILLLAAGLLLSYRQRRVKFQKGVALDATALS
jgi:hypothetical protein